MSWRWQLEPLLRPLFQAWWRMKRGTTLGVRVLAQREDGAIMLVKHTYMAGWHLPGGVLKTVRLPSRPPSASWKRKRV